MKCPNCNSDVLDLFVFCHSCGSSLKTVSRQVNVGSSWGSHKHPNFDRPQEEGLRKLNQPPAHGTFEEFRKRVAADRVAGGAKKKKNEPTKEVMINVGMMRWQNGSLRPIKGKTMAVRVPTAIRKVGLLQISVDKHGNHDRNFDRFGDYTLAFPDGAEILTIPGKPTELFQLDKYKEEVCKPYNRIILFLVHRNELHLVQGIDGSPLDSDSSDDMMQSMIDIENPTGKTLLPSNSFASGHKSSYSNVGEQQPRDHVADETANDTYANDHQEISETCDSSDASNTFAFDEILRARLESLKNSVLKPDDYLHIKVRSAVWEDTMFKFNQMQSDDLRKATKVQFLGEPAVDPGVIPKFFAFGHLTALGLLQGSPGPKCFQQSVVDYILYQNLESISPKVDEVPDSEVHESLASLLKMLKLLRGRQALNVTLDLQLATPSH
eukprot:gene1017-338_t